MPCDSSLRSGLVLLLLLLLGTSHVPSASAVCTEADWFHAVRHNDEGKIGRCIANHRNVVTAVDSAGCPALVVAAANGWFATVRRIAAVPFIDVNSACKSGRTALHYVSRAGDTRTAMELIRLGAMYDVQDNNGATPLSIAASEGNVDIVAYFCTAETGIGEGVGKLKGDWSGTKLMWAAAHNSIDDAQALLGHVASVSERDHLGQTALHWAARTGSIAALDALVEAGADIQAKSSCGWTVAFYAAFFGQADMVQHLHDLGIDLSTTDRIGWTPVMWAAYAGNADSVAALHSHGADVHNAQAHGVTPLMMAAAGNKVDVARYLLSHDGNWRAQSVRGETALDIAERLGHTSIHQLLAGLFRVSSITDRHHTEL